MLSEDAIDNLIQPFVDRQEAVNQYITGLIAERIKEVGQLSKNDIAQLNRLVQMGGDVRKINAALAQLADVQVKDVKKVIKTVAIDTYQNAKPFYDYRHKSFIPFEKNEPLQKIVSAVSKVTGDTFVNLSNSRATGFLMPAQNHKYMNVFTDIQTTYRRIIDEAIQAGLSGVDYRVAIRRALKQLADSGIRRVSWDSGYTQRLDTVVRRNVLDGIRSVRQQIDDEAGKQYGSDGKELSVHVNSALDHEPFQGHQFSNEEFENLQSDRDFEDVNGKKFSAVERAIGQYNCRHFASSIIIGQKEPKYTEQELQKFIDNNHKGFTLKDGKHLTMYECTQYQRQLETKIRQLKDSQIIAMKAGDRDLALQYQARVVKYTNDYNEFSKATNLGVKKDRLQVSGYRKIPVKV